MSDTKKKNRRSQAPIALVYFLTMLIFLAAFAVISVVLLEKFNVIDNNSSTTEVKIKSVTYNNLYARVNSKGVLCDLAVVRIAPESQKIVVIPISAYTVSSSQNTKTFRELYAEGGITKLKKAVIETYGLDVDNYVSVSNTAFETCADIFGGFSYTPPEELYYLSQGSNDNDISLNKGELVNLSGRQIRLICSYPVFSSGKQGNTEFLGTALKELINNAFRQSKITIDNLDNLYDIITSNSDTDFEKEDFKLQKSYIKEMIQENLTPADAMIPQGEWTDDSHFKVSDDFVKSLSQMTESTSPIVEESSQE